MLSKKVNDMAINSYDRKHVTKETNYFLLYLNIL